MKWQRSDDDRQDVEDRRGQGGGGGFGGLGGLGRGGIPIPIGKMGIGGTLVVLVLLAVFGRGFLGGGSGGGQPAVSSPSPRGPESNNLVDFVSFVFNDVQKTWTRAFDAKGESYRHAKLVLFTDATRSGCGYAEAATGPFYCPMDEKVYIDLGFYQELKTRFGAPGDFAQAYVIAHEVGHHVQKLLGIEEEIRRQMEQRPKDANQLSVRLELQADCFAGIWGKSTDERHILEAGDVEEGLGAAAAVGDDRLQRQAGRSVNPETWTHGSSEERARWFKRGFASGNLKDCDTFAVDRL